MENSIFEINIYDHKKEKKFIKKINYRRSY